MAEEILEKAESMDDYKEFYNDFNDNPVWTQLNDYLKNNTTIHVRVSGIVPSGVIAQVEGIRGFIPASHLSLDYVDDCNPWLGKELDVKVITADESLEKLVLSAKAVLREKADLARNEKISMLAVGSIAEGTVESLMPYGAFINLGNGLSGLVHISQICEKRIKKPSEILKIGDTVKAKILNTDNNKISLSMRALEEEITDTSEEDNLNIQEYISDETASTSLGSLLSGFHFD